MAYPKAATYADISEEVGADVIYVDGEAYYLYDETHTIQPQTAVYNANASECIENVKEVSAYYYQSASGGAVIIGDITNYASIDGLIVARVEQVTKWSYVDRTSVELLSASTGPYYLIGGCAYVPTRENLSYDTYLNLTYIYYYSILYDGDVAVTNISTTCTIYGEIY